MGFWEGGICGRGCWIRPCPAALLPVFSEGSFPWEEVWEGFPQLHGICSVCSWINQLERSCSQTQEGILVENDPQGMFSLEIVEFGPKMPVWIYWDQSRVLGTSLSWITGNAVGIDLILKPGCFLGRTSHSSPFSTSKGSLESWSSAAASCPWM